MFSLYAYMFCSDIKTSQHLEYFTSLWLAKVVIYITYHILSFALNLGRLDVSW